MDKPVISVILLVCHKDNPEVARECIDRLLNFTDVEFEIIVINNGTNDKIEGFINSIKDKRVKIFDNTDNKGIATGLNQGIRMANGDIIAYCNSDYLVGNEWASGMIKCLNETKAGLIGCMTNASGNLDQFCPTQFQMPLKYIKTTHITVFMVFPKKVWEEVGGMDENYNPFCVEDLDFAEAVKAKGHSVHIDGWTWINHRYELSKETEEFNKIRDRNWEYFKAKWPDSWQFYEDLAKETGVKK